MKIKTKFLSVIVCGALLFLAGCQGGSSNNNDTTTVVDDFNNYEADSKQSLSENEQKLINFVASELSKPNTVVTLDYLYDKESSRTYEYLLTNKDIIISFNVHRNILPNKFDIYYEFFVNKEKVFSGNGKSELVERLKELFNKKVGKTDYREINEEQIKNFLSDFQFKHSSKE